MSPPPEYYLRRAEAIDSTGLVVEKADPHLFPWVEASSGRYDWLFLTRVQIAGKTLYGFLNNGSLIVGRGKLEFPVSLGDARPEFPAIPWMVDVNSRATGGHTRPEESFRTIGLEVDKRYGNCYVGTSGGSVCGVNYSLDLRSNPDEDYWIRPVYDLSQKVARARHPWLALSAMGIASDMERDLAKNNIRITPISAHHLSLTRVPRG